MDFMKKQKIGFFINLIAIILAVVSLGIYIANVNAAYYRDMNMTIVILMAAAILALAGAVILAQQKQGMIVKVIVDILQVAAVVLIIFCGTSFISMRVESFGYIFGSNLELGNEAAFSAGTQAIAGIVLFLVTWLVSVIASFFKVKKENV